MNEKVLMQNRVSPIETLNSYGFRGKLLSIYHYNTVFEWLKYDFSYGQQNIE